MGSPLQVKALCRGATTSSGRFAATFPNPGKTIQAAPASFTARVRDIDCCLYYKKRQKNASADHKDRGGAIISGFTG